MAAKDRRAVACGGFADFLFAPSFSLKNPFSADPWRGGQLRLSVHRPLFFGGVGGSSYPRSSSCPRSRSLDLGLAISRPWLNDVLSKATQRPLSRFAVSGLCGLVQGATPPRNPLLPPLDPPLRDGLRGSFLDLENGAIWPLNGLRAKKFHVFRIKGLDPGSTGR